MGVERAVTRWYVRRQQLLDEIAALEAKLSPEAGAQFEKAPDAAARQASEQQYAQVLNQLRLLGPCPKPMMG